MRNDAISGDEEKSEIVGAGEGRRRRTGFWRREGASLLFRGPILECSEGCISNEVFLP